MSGMPIARSIPGVEVALGAQPFRGLVGELDDVGAGREGPVAGTGQDGDPRPVVAVELLELRRRAPPGARSSARCAPRVGRW